MILTLIGFLRVSGDATLSAFMMQSRQEIQEKWKRNGPVCAWPRVQPLASFLSSLWIITGLCEL